MRTVIHTSKIPYNNILDDTYFMTFTMFPFTTSIMSLVFVLSSSDQPYTDLLVLTLLYFLHLLPNSLILDKRYNNDHMKELLFSIVGVTQNLEVDGNI